MNYRHAFHAGNFADVMKHALLVRVLLHLGLKPTPFRVVDTHAGIGWYDLSSAEAERTGEWRDGVGRLGAPLDQPEAEAILRPYRNVLAACRDRHGPAAYPGSPALISALLRREDRAILIEKHPEDGLLLRQRFGPTRNVKVLGGDGWTVLPGLIPPRERRGLVLIDPPYEEAGELRRSVDRLGRAVRKWPTGTVALWYPIKDRAAVDAFASALSEALDRPALRLELDAGLASGTAGLSGSGLVVINPPWTLLEEARTLLPALAARLFGEGRGLWRAEHLAVPGSGEAEVPRKDGSLSSGP